MEAAVFKSFKVRSRFNGIRYSLLLFYDDKSKSIIIEISNRYMKTKTISSSHCTFLSNNNRQNVQNSDNIVKKLYDLVYNFLTVLATSSPVILNYSIEQMEGIQSNVSTTIFSTILPIGSFSIRGTLPIGTRELSNYAIWRLGDIAKNALAAADYSASPLIGSQFIPFSVYYSSDGVNPFGIVIQVIGEEFNILESENNLQMFQIA